MKPCMIFNGELFNQVDSYLKLKNLLLDFFRSEEVEYHSLAGLEHVISVTAGPLPSQQGQGLIYIRVYAIQLKKSGTKLPRVELVEMGPALDMKVGRTRFATNAMMKTACRVPREQRPKRVKNVEHDDLGDKYGRVHMLKQDMSQLQTRKMKALKRKESREEDDAMDEGSGGEEEGEG